MTPSSHCGTYQSAEYLQFASARLLLAKHGEWRPTYSRTIRELCSNCQSTSPWKSLSSIPGIRAARVCGIRRSLHVANDATRWPGFLRNDRSLFEPSESRSRVLIVIDTRDGSIFHSWIVSLGTFEFAVTDNGPQLVCKVFALLCTNPGVKQKATIDYHLQINGHVEIFICTLMTRLRHYVAKDQQKRDSFLQAPTYAYYT